jgi:hypothetical protein
MVEAGGVGISVRVENRELLETTKLTKRMNLAKHTQLERIWNIVFCSPRRFL